MWLVWTPLQVESVQDQVIHHKTCLSKKRWVCLSNLLEVILEATKSKKGDNTVYCETMLAKSLCRPSQICV